MKHSMILKAVAIVLAAVALVAAAGGAFGMIAMAESGLYNSTIAEIKDERMENVTSDVAYSLVEEYIKVHLSNMTENALRYSNFYNNGYDYYWYLFNDELGTGGWYYTIFAEDGKTVLESGGVMPADGTVSTPPENCVEYSHGVSLTYPKLLYFEEVRDEMDDPAATTVPDATMAEENVTSPVTFPDADECMRWFNEDTDTYFDYYFEWVESPTYMVSIYLPKDYCVGYSQGYWDLLTMLLNVQHMLLPCLLIGLAVFAIAMVYLIVAAGHKRDRLEVKAGGLNCLPLDLYTVAAVAGVVLLVAAGGGLTDWLARQSSEAINQGLMTLVLLPFLGAALLAVGYLFALAAQLKTPGGYWWRNSIIGRCLRLAARGCRWLWRTAVRMLSALSAMWQWLVTALILGAVVFLLGLAMTFSYDAYGWLILFILALIVCGAVVAYGAYAFSVILAGAWRMADGDLNRKISTKYLIGCFADCASRLNALADVAVVAARNQLKSDRMKTELITNVSHDIKTPLTSIINYVDLLQKPHTEEEGEEYLAVLARQSGRMKKLIEDLMDMSKATTGNMNVEITEMDAVEAVNQALGEFADKLAAVPLIPVVRHPESPVMIRADGKLMWRTLSNLLQNAVKYALPGTRLYVDIARVEGNVVISLKNISREELNISADELMERFVRGDTSRNTEGSGLGLNIAKSLMELQRGQLRILVDGDLFKTSMIFPAVE